jgi:hypothetical protein
MTQIESTIAELDVEIDGLRLEPRVFRRGNWTRKTTVIHLLGGGEERIGEEVTWATADQDRFVAARKEAPVTGRLLLGELFERLAVAAAAPTGFRWLEGGMGEGE